MIIQRVVHPISDEMEGEYDAAEVERSLFRGCGGPSSSLGFGGVVEAVDGEVPAHATAQRVKFQVTPVPEADQQHGGDLGEQDHHSHGHRFLPRPEPAGDGIEEVSAEPLGKVMCQLFRVQVRLGLR